MFHNHLPWELKIQHGLHSITWAEFKTLDLGVTQQQQQLLNQRNDIEIQEGLLHRRVSISIQGFNCYRHMVTGKQCFKDMKKLSNLNRTPNAGIFDISFLKNNMEFSIEVLIFQNPSVSYAWI